MRGVCNSQARDSSRLDVMSVSDAGPNNEESTGKEGKLNGNWEEFHARADFQDARQAYTPRLFSLIPPFCGIQFSCIEDSRHKVRYL